jgi:hypothetical protein
VCTYNKRSFLSTIELSPWLANDFVNELHSGSQWLIMFCLSVIPTNTFNGDLCLDTTIARKSYIFQPLGLYIVCFQASSVRTTIFKTRSRMYAVSRSVLNIFMIPKEHSSVTDLDFMPTPIYFYAYAFCSNSGRAVFFFPRRNIEMGE